MKISSRKYKISDLDRHIELLKSNKINVSKNKEGIWLENAIENYNKKAPKFYVLAITLNKKLIGNIIAEKIKNKRVDIGFWIGKRYQREGYATEALKSFIGKLKRKFKIKAVYANCKKNNKASKKVLNKNGFKVIRKKGNKIYFKKRLK